MPVTAILLVVIFGSLVSAALPFVVAALAVLGSLVTLLAVNRLTDVSVFAINLTTGLGLALGIDYDLLMVNRFREQLKTSASTEEAVVNTVATAGKTVLVSGAMVAVTLAGLMVFPQYFLKSFAYAGISAALLAVVGSLTVLPALLAILGPRVDALKVRRGDLSPRDSGAWVRIACTVMRHPYPVMAGSIAILLIMAAPALSVTLGQVDERDLPVNSPAAIAGQAVRDSFPGQAAAPDTILLVGPSTEPNAIQTYADRLSELPGVLRVVTPTSIATQGLTVPTGTQPGIWTTGEIMRMVVIPERPPFDEASADRVDAIRQLPAPADQVLVGGQAATYRDANEGLLSKGWILALWIGTTTTIIIFLFTGSVIMPLKVLVLNLLSLAATLGVLVWVFQDGHLAWLVGDFTPTGSIAPSSIALIAVVAFALSTDYEIFLLARIKEERDAGRTNTDAVAYALQRTGRIITAAALLIAVVFTAFLTSRVTNIKQLGLGVTVAILVDATLIRVLLVPAFLRVAGAANWWAPGPLRRLHDRIGLRDGGDPVSPAGPEPSSSR